MELVINNKPQIFIKTHVNTCELKNFIEQELGLKSENYYLLCNGKRIEEFNDAEFKRIYIIPRILGGKGGFGSMLRAIGAQIEKTTNREACRDLSGRRLRDINEEQRLKNWINQQADREKEAKEKRQKKLERLCEIPKHEFKDEQYDKERSELPEIVEDALLQGLQASCSTKRKHIEKKPVVKNKKAKLWLNDELDDDISSSGSEDETDSEENNKSCGTAKSSESINSNNSEDNQNKCIEDINMENDIKKGELSDNTDISHNTDLKNDKQKLNEGKSNEMNETKEEIEMCSSTSEEKEQSSEKN